MNIILNGSPKHLNDGVHLEDIVRDLCKNPAHVIAELNGAIVASCERPVTKVKDGDRLELVAFVGGG
ncbi:MAG: sulfur carrier protein ThiS [Candidatus Omnitrophica bacterium]|nr:sulfur carrier protein ThiS [Candidatus Omnitrophota bacterium]